MGIFEKFKELQNIRNILYFFCIGLLGLVVAWIAGYYDNIPVTGQEQWYDPKLISSVLSNISAGLIVISILYFFRKRFFREEEDQLSLFDNYKDLSLKFDDLTAELKNVNSFGTGTSLSSKNAYKGELYDLLESALEEVIIIGHGFPCHDKESLIEADDYYSLLVKTLKRNVKIKMFQYLNPISIKWIDKLSRLKTGNRRGLKLYFSGKGNPVYRNLAIAIIDPGHENAAVVVMFPGVSNEIKLNILEPQISFVFKDAQGLSLKMKDNVEPLFREDYLQGYEGVRELKNRHKKFCENAVSTFIKENTGQSIISTGKEKIHEIANVCGIYETDLIASLVRAELSKERHLYFAYGRFMDIHLFEQQCSSAKILGMGYITKHDLVLSATPSFQIEEEDYNTVLNIKANAKTQNKVYGIVYAISNEDFTRFLENKMKIGFMKKDVRVHIAIEELHNATLLWFNQNNKTRKSVDRRYQNHILNAIDHHDFPEKYVTVLKRTLNLKTVEIII